ncbi:MAG: T9SS type A sorting domain-containing protein [Melioribacteraceae bacterium]|nr:T9SS type A sorting domain-containing protein [Melioribacteraceae bacterium]
MKINSYNYCLPIIVIILFCLLDLPDINCQGISWQKTIQVGETCWGEKVIVNSDQNIDFFSRYRENNKNYVAQKRYSKNGDEIESFVYEMIDLRIFNDVAIDGEKNVYVLYEMELFPYHNECLRKYGSNGELIWTVTLPWEYSYMCIDFDQNDNPFAAGYHRINDNQTEAFVTKFDQDGNILWTNTFTLGSWSKILIKSISLDNNDNIFIVGHTGWTAQDIFIAKFDTDGNVVWEKTIGTTNDDEGWCVTNDQNNNVIVYGYIDRQWVSYENTGWIGKYNNDGEAIFETTTYHGHEIGGPMYPTAVRTDLADNIYIAGCHGCPGFTSKYEPDGTKLWDFIPQNWDASLEDIPVSIDVDFENNLYFIGDSSTQAAGKFVIMGKVDPNISGIVDEDKDYIIKEFKLSQNYPNPFNPTTKISYDLPKGSTVKLKVFNSIGKEIKTLVDERQNAGRYTIDFDGTDLASGVYYYSLTADNYREVKKMILLK